MADIEIKKSVLSFPVFFEKVENFTIEDDRFTKVKIFLMHTGLNYNNSFFDKVSIDEAIPTLEYIPIVGFIEDKLFDGKDFTEHRYIITKDEKGVRRKYIGHGYGVILSNADNNAHYEMRICDDGIEREFLVVDGVIWNMFEDSSDIINRDLVKNHSMELHEPSIDGYEDENGVFHFTKFSFRAACILGDDKEPAMINSTVEVQFTMSDFVKSFQSELNDKYTTFTKMVNQNQEGGTTMPKTDFTQTVMQQFEDISNMVSQHEVVKDRWGDAVPRYYAVDIQDNEVIVVDRANNYQHYGLPFTMNGDKAEINFACGNRKKIRYENYEENAVALQGSFDFGEHIAKIEETAFQKVTDAEKKVVTAEEKVTTAETNYSTIKSDYDEIKPKYDEYVKAEQKQQEEALNAEKDAMFEKFEEELNDNADFAKLKEQKAEMSVEEIEQKCAVLYTRSVKSNQKKDNSDKSNFSKNDSATVEVMDDVSGADDNTSYVPTKYGNIPIRR